MVLTDKAKKSLSLFSSMVLSLIVGILISIINTRYLGKEQYGDFKFLLNLFSLVVTFLTFGFFYTGGLILAKSDDKVEKRIISGDILKIATLSSLLLVLISLIFSYFEHIIFGNELGPVIRITLPLLIIFPFQLCFEQLLQGSNRIYSLSVLRIGPKLVYIVLALGLYFFSSFSLVSALIAHLSSFALIIGVVIFLIKPTFKKGSPFISQIRKENRTVGFPIYIGAITGIASTYLAGITISLYIDNINVGFYSLAVTATMPLTMLPSSFGITFFKSFVSYARIPVKIIFVTLVIGVSALSGFLIFIDEIVIWLYTEEFSPVIELSYYIAFGALLHGFGDFIIRFLYAKGLGKTIRNSNIILGVFNTLGFIILPKYMGVNGAALTRMMAGALFMAIMIFNYYNFIKNDKRKTTKI